MKETGRATVDVGPGGKPGEVIVNTWDTKPARAGRRATSTVKVERMGERKLRINVLGCGIVVEQTAEPNDHQATVVAQPQQDIDHYRGPINVFGTLQFEIFAVFHARRDPRDLRRQLRT